MSDRTLKEEIYCSHELVQNYIKQLQARLDKIQAEVDRQAEDEGLWFISEYATEQYLQDALRKLHQIVEDK